MHFESGPAQPQVLFTAREGGLSVDAAGQLLSLAANWRREGRLHTFLSQLLSVSGQRGSEMAAQLHIFTDFFQTIFKPREALWLSQSDVWHFLKVEI